LKELTKKQALILDMLLEQGKSVQSISKHQKTSRTAVYKTIKQLKKKGYLASNFREGLQNGDGVGDSPPQCKPCTTKGQHHQIRLHGQEFNITILYDSQRYKKTRQKKQVMHIEGNTLRLFEKKIELYAARHLSFYGDTAKEATSVSINYWNRIFTRIESTLNIIIIKGMATKIREVKAHYAEIDNELAEDCLRKSKKIHVKGEDGREWLLVDNSWQLRELETIHSETALDDMQEVVQPFFNDLRGYYAQTGQSLIMTDIVKAVGEMGAVIKVYDANIKAHLDVMERINRGLEDFSTEIRKYNENNKRFNNVLNKLERKV